jgi:hypothetical protein
MAMETEVVCPDCGKVIAPKGKVEELRRCKCGDALREQQESEAATAAALAQGGSKHCYVCGADLAGRVRLKDHLGRYWCKQCASADKKAKRREEKGRCADCSRVFPPDKLQYFQNAKICPTCFKNREKALEQKIKKEHIETRQTTHEWKTILWLAIGAAVLILLGTLNHFLKIF